MWTTLHQQYPNFKVLVHNQYFHGDYPVAVDLILKGSQFLDNKRKVKWPKSHIVQPTQAVIQGQQIYPEAIRQLRHWLDQNQYLHCIAHQKLTVYLKSDQVTDALKFLTHIQTLLPPDAISVRAVDDSVGQGEKKVSGKFKKFQYQVILKPGWYTRADAEQWLHVVKTQDPDIYMTAGLRENFHHCLSQNYTNCSVTSTYVFVKDQSTLTYLWLNFPTAIKKTYKLVHHA